MMSVLTPSTIDQERSELRDHAVDHRESTAVSPAQRSGILAGLKALLASWWRPRRQHFPSSWEAARPQRLETLCDMLARRYPDLYLLALSGC
jgi:hypothetical protein